MLLGNAETSPLETKSIVAKVAEVAKVTKLAHTEQHSILLAGRACVQRQRGYNVVDFTTARRPKLDPTSWRRCWICDLLEEVLDSIIAPIITFI